MNLFVTDFSPKQSAINLDDKRVGKLLMEACQMMSLGIKLNCKYGYVEGPGFLTRGLSHMNHPVSLWVRETRGNFDWTYEHALHLNEEWQHRYGSSHAAGDRLPYIGENRECIPEGELQLFQNSARHNGLLVDFTNEPVPQSYRHYLNYRWKNDKSPPKWTNRNEPEWYSK